MLARVGTFAFCFLSQMMRSEFAGVRGYVLECTVHCPRESEDWLRSFTASRRGIRELAFE